MKESTLRLGAILVSALLSACARSSDGGTSDDTNKATQSRALVQAPGTTADLIASIQSTYGRVDGVSGARSAVLLPSVASSVSPIAGSTRLSAPGGVAATAWVTYASGAASTSIKDANSATAVTITALGSGSVTAESSGGYVLYRDALGAGAHIVHRPTSTGDEDFVVVPSAATVSSLAYDVHLDAGVAGLRQVGDVLEFLDAGGDPRLRVTQPTFVDSQGTERGAHLTVTGCAVDTSPVAPWGRQPRVPGAATCRVTVDWDSEGVAYPVLVDPSWSTTSTMVYPRWRAAGMVLSSGLTLVAGGTPSTTSPATSQPVAELYNESTGTWAATGSVNIGHTDAAGASFPGGYALILGGLCPFAQFICTTRSPYTLAEIYNASTGAWTVATKIDTNGWTGMTATTLTSGSVLVVGGSYAPQGCYLYTSGGTITTCASAPQGFSGQSATALSSGSVLFSGGTNASGGTNTTAYLYTTRAPTSGRLPGRM